MSKFKVRLKIQAFELEVEGSRDDIPLIAHNIGAEIAGILEPAAHIVEGDDVKPVAVRELTPSPAQKRPRGGTRGIAKKVTESQSEEQVIDWKHDPTKWGVPQQSWSTANKAIWLLYVVEQEIGRKELSGGSIAATFNKHFKEAKLIQAGNVNRDLGRLKVKPNTSVSDDTTKSPSTWFLTQEGHKAAEELVAHARGQQQ